jgi:hypothetical protein
MFTKNHGYANKALGENRARSSCAGANRRCGSGTPLKPHSLYRVFPRNMTIRDFFNGVPLFFTLRLKIFCD